jgi:hypothetical protein
MWVIIVSQPLGTPLPGAGRKSPTRSETAVYTRHALEVIRESSKISQKWFK